MSSMHSFFRSPARCDGRRPLRRARRGRVLVEPCVALVVLAAGSASLLLVASASAHFVDGVRMQTLAAQLSDRALAQTLRDGCHGVTGGQSTAPRLVVRAVPAGSGTVHGIRIVSSWSYAPLAGGGRRDWHHDSSSTALWCE